MHEPNEIFIFHREKVKRNTVLKNQMWNACMSPTKPQNFSLLVLVLVPEMNVARWACSTGRGRRKEGDPSQIKVAAVVTGDKQTEIEPVQWKRKEKEKKEKKQQSVGPTWDTTYDIEGATPRCCCTWTRDPLSFNAFLSFTVLINFTSFAFHNSYHMHVNVNSLVMNHWISAWFSWYLLPLLYYFVIVRCPPNLKLELLDIPPFMKDCYLNRKAMELFQNWSENWMLYCV
jgi:hypothetical protein